jgi:uncharacterized membrane protein
MHVNTALLADAPLAVRIHLATVIPAFFIGGWLLLVSTKGAPPHRWLGAFYLVLMTTTAITTLFIRNIDPGHFSFIHLFIPLTLFGVVGGVWRLRQGDIKGHRNAMIALYVGALLIAGGFTFSPGRLMHAVFFG